MSQYKYTVVFQPAEEGGYVVTVPALPGLVTEGETFEEAKQMAEEAIQCHLDSMRARGLEIPIELPDKPTLTDHIQVNVA